VVPSASAVIVLLVAISTDRLLLGIVLIASFGIGMAAVLGGLAMVVGRIGTLAGSRVGPMSRPLVRRAAGALPSVAALVVIATGLAFTYGALAQLS
jgi:ABC-type nickel/cobalt efflux system permease component RcnA